MAWFVFPRYDLSYLGHEHPVPRRKNSPGSESLKHSKTPRLRLQEPSDHPGVPESLAFDIFWPLKVSEGQGAKFAEFLLRALEFQELNLNLKEIDRKSKFQWIWNIFQWSHIKL